MLRPNFHQFLFPYLSLRKEILGLGGFAKCSEIINLEI